MEWKMKRLKFTKTSLEKYQQAHEYSTMRRTFNFGLRKVY